MSTHKTHEASSLEYEVKVELCCLYVLGERERESHYLQHHILSRPFSVQDRRAALCYACRAWQRVREHRSGLRVVREPRGALRLVEAFSSYMTEQAPPE